MDVPLICCVNWYIGMLESNTSKRTIGHGAQSFFCRLNPYYLSLEINFYFMLLLLHPIVSLFHHRESHPTNNLNYWWGVDINFILAMLKYPYNH